MNMTVTIWRKGKREIVENVCSATYFSDSDTMCLITPTESMSVKFDDVSSLTIQPSGV